MSDDEAASEPELSEYDKFEDLTKKLLQVSKKELDDARAREHAAPKPA